MLFDTRSVAVIGASRDKNKVGYAILNNLKKTFRGKIYPVNPKAKSVLGVRCYSSILDVRKRVDLAVIAIPSKYVPSVLEDCGRAKIKAVVVISAGFKEAGIEGAKLERECVRIVRKYKMQMVGPNCLGVIDTSTGLNATFGKEMPLRGNIAFMSQSGALCSAILDWAPSEGIGFSKFVSLGNKADLTENHFLRLFYSDEETEVVLAYLEGLENSEEFVNISRKISKRKPMVMLKAGRTPSGMKAVASHTGTLTGSEDAYNAVFKKSGIIRADSVEELFDHAEAFSNQPLPRDNRVAIVTNAGGPGILATDACERASLKLASFQKSTIEKLKKNMPAAANIYNPVDVLGDAMEDRYSFAVNTVLKDRGVDSVIVLVTPQLMTDPLKIAKVIVKESRKTKKPILCSFMGSIAISKAVEELKNGKVPDYPFPERAVNSLNAMVHYTEIRGRAYHKLLRFTVNKKGVRRVLDEYLARGKLGIGLDSLTILGCYGIPVCRSLIVKNVEQALEFAKKIRTSLALKVVSDDILHKTDIGCVALNVTKDNLETCYNSVLHNAKKFMPHAVIKGMLVQEMVTGGKETIIGMSRESVGSLMMFGLGGIYVEILKDVSFGLAPISRAEAKEMIKEIKGSPVLRGVRGEKPSDINALVDCLLRTSQLVCDFPEIVELDINPIKVFEKGCCALDARIVLRKE